MQVLNKYFIEKDAADFSFFFIYLILNPASGASFLEFELVSSA